MFWWLEAFQIIGRMEVQFTSDPQVTAITGFPDLSCRGLNTIFSPIPNLPGNS